MVVAVGQTRQRLKPEMTGNDLRLFRMVLDFGWQPGPALAADAGGQDGADLRGA
jgi:hypothetical protein